MTTEQWELSLAIVGALLGVTALGGLCTWLVLYLRETK